MKVLDLFSGLGGWSQSFKERGHEVVTVEIEQKFNPTICKNIMELTKEDFKQWIPFDVVLASPPCNCFSIASVYRHWDKETRRPKDQQTYDSIDLVGHTIKLILSVHPMYWILENPRGMLRNVLGKPQVTTYYASWGDWKLKPTDLWGVIPPGIKWKKPKKWVKAPRGSHTGTQGIEGNYIKKSWPKNFTHYVRDTSLRALIPYGLSESICLACENQCHNDNKNKEKKLWGD